MDICGHNEKLDYPNLKSKAEILCRDNVFPLPQIQKFVAELLKSVYFTVE